MKLRAFCKIPWRPFPHERAIAVKGSVIDFDFLGQLQSAPPLQQTGQ
ncbi:hypothetical protein YPPY13_4478 [Yersinia pestis PY-13]|uniref:Uncharacterized protein n=1 Tax=Yersinia pestis PY-08 TaxID=992134 RepID=A0AB72ZDR6_YERPE|nr:hypothetical protein YPPY01_4390 [Yersinia pestis PY-01]EIQ83790.1 hypothetical protein YPPY03_4526 [Yersinia pestis PY-03]EIQ83811.1 hypothetical protein YPPY02_4447 [Yersinia pestis PY-02]EIQ96923.1 hypothetical protein YPPY04_4455 [Yersinia pestis PY-04]EIQ98098.1 hypothetical protein YPPY05_4436 [Yersinia pestis PY-05]EIR01281.1 hypothetical protein YPPY06_4495 [Yersinia pestis PY-06]EIR12405.1 hypothetical protein YPPY07_4355 [Yersinia pestis PY-07]EIR12485.1 hypothetical protein YPP